MRFWYVPANYHGRGYGGGIYGCGIRGCGTIIGGSLAATTTPTPKQVETAPVQVPVSVPVAEANIEASPTAFTPEEIAKMKKIIAMAEATAEPQPITQKQAGLWSGIKNIASKGWNLAKNVASNPVVRTLAPLALGMAVPYLPGVATKGLEMAKKYKDAMGTKAFNYLAPQYAPEYMREGMTNPEAYAESLQQRDIMLDNAIQREQMALQAMADEQAKKEAFLSNPVAYTTNAVGNAVGNYVGNKIGNMRSGIGNFFSGIGNFITGNKGGSGYRRKRRGRLRKGSLAAKMHMARLRAMRGKKRSKKGKGIMGYGIWGGMFRGWPLSRLENLYLRSKGKEYVTVDWTDKLGKEHHTKTKRENIENMINGTKKMRDFYIRDPKTGELRDTDPKQLRRVILSGIPKKKRHYTKDQLLKKVASTAIKMHGDVDANNILANSSGSRYNFRRRAPIDWVEAEKDLKKELKKKGIKYTGKKYDYPDITVLDPREFRPTPQQVLKNKASIVGNVGFMVGNNRKNRIGEAQIYKRLNNMEKTRAGVRRKRNKLIKAQMPAIVRPPSKRVSKKKSVAAADNAASIAATAKILKKLSKKRSAVVAAKAASSAAKAAVAAPPAAQPAAQAMAASAAVEAQQASQANTPAAAAKHADKAVAAANQAQAIAATAPTKRKKKASQDDYADLFTTKSLGITPGPSKWAIKRQKKVTEGYKKLLNQKIDEKLKYSQNPTIMVDIPPSPTASPPPIVFPGSLGSIANSMNYDKNMANILLESIKDDIKQILASGKLNAIDEASECEKKLLEGEDALGTVKIGMQKIRKKYKI